MYNLILKELRETRWVLITGILVLTIMGIFAAWSYTLLPMLDDMIIEFLGPELARQIDQISSNFTIYLWSQWQPKNLLQIGTIVALILSAPAIAGEIHRGSAEYLTSLPVSRTKILAAKAIAGVLMLSVIIWVSTLAMLAVASLIEQPILWGRLLAATALTNLGLIAVYAVGLAFSARGNDTVKSGALAAALLFVWSATGLHRSTYLLSPFWHMKGMNWFAGAASFPWYSVAMMLGVIIAAGLLANYLFTKREI